MESETTEAARVVARILGDRAVVRYGPRMDSTLTARLERLESTLAHLEHLFDQLNAVVVQQDKRLDRLVADCARLSETLNTMELERARNATSKPPHYQ